MNIFISWSGSRSRMLAQMLSDWLADVFQGDHFFMSDHDIKAGSRWSEKLNNELCKSKFGVICLTSDNLNAPWLLFEAGALLKAIDDHVVPYLLSIRPTDIRGPLAQFQAVNADKDGTFRLVKRINELREAKLDDERLNKSFSKWWPDLETQISAIPQENNESEIAGPDKTLLEDILEVIKKKNTNMDFASSNPADILFGNRFLYLFAEDDFDKLSTSDILTFVHMAKNRQLKTSDEFEKIVLTRKINLAILALSKMTNQ